MWKKMTFHTTDGNNITVNGNFNTSMTFSAYIETLMIWPLTIPTSVTRTLRMTLLHKTKTMTMPITTRSVEKTTLRQQIETLLWVETLILQWPLMLTYKHEWRIIILNDHYEILYWWLREQTFGRDWRWMTDLMTWLTRQ